MEYNMVMNNYRKRQKLTGVRNRLQGTRKIGCQHIVCKQYILYPDYAIPKKETFHVKRKERLMKEDSLKQLRKEFCHDNVKTLIKYHISLYQQKKLTIRLTQQGVHM